MLVLALDTTTAAGSVALASDDRALEVAAIDPAQPVATRLPGDLAALLARHEVALTQIDIFAVASGPGSFTGLRIGIATMQGLAMAEGKPLVGVSAFNALATFVDAPHVATWIDAWRGEVYAATYSTAADPLATRHVIATPKGIALQSIDDPVVDTPANLLRRGATPDSRSATFFDVANDPATRFIGDGAVRHRDLIGAHRVIQPTPLLAGAIASLACRRARAGELPPPHAIRPIYVRRPDAELARDRAGITDHRTEHRPA